MIFTTILLLLQNFPKIYGKQVQCENIKNINFGKNSKLDNIRTCAMDESTSIHENSTSISGDSDGSVEGLYMWN